MTARATITLALVLLATGACTKPSDSAAPPTPVAETPIAEAEAEKIADRVQHVWTSMDAARIKAIYAPGIVGLDVMTAPLSTDRATWDKLQDGYAAAKLDKLAITSRKIQLLGPDVFVVSGIGDASSTAIPAKLRYTDVFQKQADGDWLIVNEHVSVAPKG